MLYTTPEQVHTSLQLKRALREVTVSVFLFLLFHFQDFRPAYRALHKLRSIPGLESVSFIALTATATKKVQQKIVQVLELRDPLILTSTVNRPNIFVSVKYVEHLFMSLEPSEVKSLKKERDISKQMILKLEDAWHNELIKRRCTTDCGIIYVHRKKDAEDAAWYLSSKYGLSIEPFHSRIGCKHEVQRRWELGQVHTVLIF